MWIVVIDGETEETAPAAALELGQKLAQQTNLEVEVTNLSINSGTGCDSVGRLLTYLNHRKADLTLTAFFADDLQQYKGISQK